MTDPDALARALARLADHDEYDTTDEREARPTHVVADAEAAMGSVGDAAAFLDGDGEATLHRAVRAAENAGDDDLAARGRAVLATLAAFRDAAAGGERPLDDARTTSTPLAQRSSREGA